MYVGDRVPFLPRVVTEIPSKSLVKDLDKQAPASKISRISENEYPAISALLSSKEVKVDHDSSTNLYSLTASKAICEDIAAKSHVVHSDARGGITFPANHRKIVEYVNSTYALELDHKTNYDRNVITMDDYNYYTKIPRYNIVSLCSYDKIQSVNKNLTNTQLLTGYCNMDLIATHNSVNYYKVSFNNSDRMVAEGVKGNSYFDGLNGNRVGITNINKKPGYSYKSFTVDEYKDISSKFTSPDLSQKIRDAKIEEDGWALEIYDLIAAISAVYPVKTSEIVTVKLKNIGTMVCGPEDKLENYLKNNRIFYFTYTKFSVALYKNDA